MGYNVFDSLTGLVNKITGLGTARDKLTGQRWEFTAPEAEQLHNVFRSSWVCRKAISAPANDLFRQGWTWEADADDVVKLVAEEKRLQVRQKMKRARLLSRLYGGAVILVGDGSPTPEEPLEAVGLNGLRYMHVFHRYQVASGTTRLRLDDPLYGQPKDYTFMAATGNASARVHPSRIVRFEGLETGGEHGRYHDDWGDSAITPILREISGFAVGVASTSRMLEESTVNYYRMKGLYEKLATTEGTEIVTKALQLIEAKKSAINAVAIDSEDGNLDQFRADFAGLPEIVRLLLQCVAGGADIPMTRLLGQSPDGMNATGDGDMRNYYDRLKGEQEDDIAPAHDQINRFLIQSALGTEDAGMTVKYNPLWQMTEEQQVDADQKKLAAVQTASDTGRLPEDVLGEVVKNIMINSPTFPGAAQAFEVSSGQMSDTGRDAGTDDMEDATRIGDGFVYDGTPAPLYVRRDVLNGAEIVRWAKSQGFGETLDPDDMHITIAHSRSPVDWHRAGASYQQEVSIGAGGPRTVEQFNKGAVVLQVVSDELEWRHKAIKDAGASWDWPDYKPHVTISYNAEGVDLSKVTPYQGEIKLGPEIFERVK